ncbi:TPA: hypothetical protein ACN2NR_000949 [Staphylococcus aureus]
MKVGKSMEGLNHRRNTENEETTQTQSVAPNTGEEQVHNQLRRPTYIMNLSINKWKPKRMKQRKIQI